jgi:hypothetical protein
MISNEVGANLNKKDTLKIKYNPAVTIVAAWIREETGVGPSIASGNQRWRPNWADLPTQAIIKKIVAALTNVIAFVLLRMTLSSALLDRSKLSKNKARLLKINKSVVFEKNWIIEIAIKNARSPTLLTVTAKMDDLFAWIRKYQKLISRYEQIPTPSQPTKIKKRLLEHTKMYIKKVNNDRYEKNLGLCGSNAIYSTEYNWANNDIVLITNNIVQVNGSIRIP